MFEIRTVTQERMSHKATQKPLSYFKKQLEDVRARIALDDKEENEEIIAKVVMRQIGRRVITQAELNERFARLGSNSRDIQY